jgi:hypothetical protein
MKSQFSLHISGGFFLRFLLLIKEGGVRKTALGIFRVGVYNEKNGLPATY